MKGLYILGNPHLNNCNIIKIGMSMRLEERLYDYDDVFTNNRYYFCYETHTLSKEQILYIEKLVLNETKDLRNIGLSSEYRNLNDIYTIDKYHNIIINTLELLKIEYTVIKNPEFTKPHKIKLDEIEILNRTNELGEIKTNPFQISKREKLQEEYLKDIMAELDKNKKALCIAPTGFGKTVMIYKLISIKKYLRIIIFTPRKLLNEQTIDNKYTQQLENNYNKIIFNNSSEKYKIELTNKLNNKENLIIVVCYQSAKSLLSYIETHYIDIVIFDEAHFIQSWEEKTDSDDDKFDYINFYLESETIKNRLFLTATPPENMLLNAYIFGNSINKIKVYELINDGILCNIETITKKINDDDKYKCIYSIVSSTIKKYNKKKGIIYVNTQYNACELYKLCKNKDIPTYLYISEVNDDIYMNYDCNEELKKFEQNKKSCLIITCKKIDYGYDNIWIDLICYADERQGDIDIRQTMGRGLRNNENIYQNKILHVILPIIVRDKYDVDNYKHVIAYLKYIVEEVGQDIIYVNSEIHISGNKKKILNNDYDGDNIEPELCKFLSTTYKNYEHFARFLRENDIYDEITYNKFQEMNQWIPEFNKLRDKYKKFCFRDIHPLNKTFYWTKKECVNKYNKILSKLKKEHGDNIFDFTQRELFEKINNIDKKIPMMNFNLYYPL